MTILKYIASSCDIDFTNITFIPYHWKKWCYVLSWSTGTGYGSTCVMWTMSSIKVLNLFDFFPHITKSERVMLLWTIFKIYKFKLKVVLHETSISTELFSAISISPSHWDCVQFSLILLNIHWICFSFWVSCFQCGSFDSSAGKYVPFWRGTERSCFNRAEVTMLLLVTLTLHRLRLNRQWALQRDELFWCKCIAHANVFTKKQNKTRSH